MTKKHLAFALSLLAILLLAPAMFAASTCSSGATIQFMGVGSSAQFNTLAYAAEDVIGNANFNLMSFKSYGSIVDSGPNYEAIPQPSLSDSATAWIAWDNGANCNVYAYFSVDSGVGVKSFMRSIKLTVGTKSYQVAGTYPAISSSVTSSPACGGTSSNCNQVGGLADGISAGSSGLTVDILPTTVYNAITVVPASYVAQVPTPSPQPYCGQLNGTAGFYCSFNAAGTDVRPEDALYAFTRALSAYNTTNGLSGLGYNVTGCGANSSYPTEIGCPIYDAFGQKKTFNNINFVLSGADPLSKGTVPAFTTMTVGAAPLVVFVSHQDTSNFGATATSAHGNPSYLYNNINRNVLSKVFDGTLSCTGDILGNGSGAGAPIQVVAREPLSGTYNAFEFTGVRTMYGSAPTAVALNKVSSLTWLTQDDSGQENLNNPTLNVPACQNGLGGNAPIIPCGDPMAIYSGPDPSAMPATGCTSGATLLTGAPLRLHSIGTGVEVPAALGLYNSTTSNSSLTSTPFNVEDGIGYTFWSYGNLAKVQGTGCTSGNPVTCSTYLGHYLTVDGIDPFFATAGGELDVNPNPNGAFVPPQCNLSPSVLGTSPCFALPFTHIYDGSYPLWSQLRIMTFATVSGKSAPPAGVLNLVAYDMAEVANPARNTSDFAPLLTGLTNSGTLTAPVWKGNLNLWVFRSHYLQSKVNPNNGHEACGGVFTGILLGANGGSCLADVGGDAGGDVLTVQGDVDFHADFGGVALLGGTAKAPQEIYGVRQ